MADPNINPEQAAADLDELLSDSVSIDDGRSVGGASQNDAGGLAELETSLDAALADAESRIAALVSGGEGSAGSIDALDEQLADSTPVDFDIRADIGQPASAPVPAVVETPDSDSVPEAITAETPDAEDEPEPTAAAETIEDAAPEVEAEINDTDQPSSDAGIDTPASPNPVEERLEQEAAPPAPEDTPAPEPTIQESAAPAVPEPTPISASPIDEREVLLGSDAEAAPVAPKRLSAAKALVIVPRVVSSPLVLVSPDIRDMIGWLALVTAFNAVALWAYILLVH